MVALPIQPCNNKLSVHAPWLMPVLALYMPARTTVTDLLAPSMKCAHASGQEKYRCASRCYGVEAANGRRSSLPSHSVIFLPLSGTPFDWPAHPTSPQSAFQLQQFRLPLRRAKNLRFLRTRKVLSHQHPPPPLLPPPPPHRAGFYPLFSTFSYHHHQHHKLFGVRSVEQIFSPSSSYHCFLFSFPIPFGLFSVWVFDLKAASFVSLNPLIP